MLELSAFEDGERLRRIQSLCSHAHVFFLVHLPRQYTSTGINLLLFHRLRAPTSLRISDKTRYRIYHFSQQLVYFSYVTWILNIQPQLHFRIFLQRTIHFVGERLWFHLWVITTQTAFFFNVSSYLLSFLFLKLITSSFKSLLCPFILWQVGLICGLCPIYVYVSHKVRHI